MPVCRLSGDRLRSGFQPVCGFNYGAGKRERVEKAFWFGVKVASAVLLVTAVVGFVLSDRLIALFRQGDAEVIAIGSFALRCQCVTLPLVGWVIMNNMMFQTCGYTSPRKLLRRRAAGLVLHPRGHTAAAAARAARRADKPEYLRPAGLLPCGVYIQKVRAAYVENVQGIAFTKP